MEVKPMEVLVAPTESEENQLYQGQLMQTAEATLEATLPWLVAAHHLVLGHLEAHIR